jgi:hypothetical protein
MKKLLLAILIGIVCSLNFSFANVLAGTTYTAAGGHCAQRGYVVEHCPGLDG